MYVRHSNFITLMVCLDRSLDCALLSIFILTNAFNLEKQRGCSWGGGGDV